MPSRTADFSQSSFGLNVNLSISAPILLSGAPAGVVVEPSMLAGANGFSVLPLLTVGETLLATTGALNDCSAGRYTPVGGLDGIGASTGSIPPRCGSSLITS